MSRQSRSRSGSSTPTRSRRPTRRRTCPSPRPRSAPGRRGCSRCSSCSSGSRCRPRTSATRRSSARSPSSQPTLLFDEVDAIFGPKARDREDLRGMLNAGYRRGAVACRMGGANNDDARGVPGVLPEGVRRDRRAARHDRRPVDPDPARAAHPRRADRAVPPPRRRSSRPSRSASRSRRLARAITRRRSRYARPELPDELDDRAQDLLGAAARDRRPGRRRLAGPGARGRGRALDAARQREDESLGARLLADIHNVFDANGTERYKTADLIAELATIEESPWGDWYGKPITRAGALASC